MRRSAIDMIRRITTWMPRGRGGSGTPRMGRWEEIEQDIKTLEIANCRSRCNNRSEWKKMTIAAKSQKKL